MTNDASPTEESGGRRRGRRVALYMKEQCGALMCESLDSIKGKRFSMKRQLCSRTGCLEKPGWGTAFPGRFEDTSG